MNAVIIERILVLAYIAIGFLMIGLGIPLMRGKIKRNLYYGVRTPKTLASDEHWYPINAVGGKYLALSGLVWIFGSLIAAALPFFLPLGVGAICFYLSFAIIPFIAMAFMISPTLKFERSFQPK
ncbi:MAG: SdpI family protein [Candidatus Kapabacteria bacterium]|jgi:uncharacterized membrane protein|nr:SdpI family protein [Candidatus Kapabacteria bacterium]